VCTEPCEVIIANMSQSASGGLCDKQCLGSLSLHQISVYYAQPVGLGRKARGLLDNHADDLDVVNMPTLFEYRRQQYCYAIGRDT
jgi:hypothetical protein